MTISRLKRIELIVTIVVTVLLLTYALAVGWLIYTLAAGGFIGVKYGSEFWQPIRYIPNFTPLIYGLLALTLTPIMLLIIRRVTQKNVAALTLFFTTLPSTILLFGLPLTVFPLIILLYWAGIRWSFETLIVLSVLVGIILSLAFSLLGRTYIAYRNKSIHSNEDSR